MSGRKYLFEAKVITKMVTSTTEIQEKRETQGT